MAGRARLGLLPAQDGNGRKFLQARGQLPSYYLPANGKAADSDKLDGIDFTGFARGAIQNARAIVQPNTTATLFDVAGLATVIAGCSHIGSPDVLLQNSDAQIEVYTPGGYLTIAPDSLVGIGGWQGTGTIQLGRTALVGFTLVQHVATVTIGLAAGTPCRAEAQAVRQP